MSKLGTILVLQKCHTSFCVVFVQQWHGSLVLLLMVGYVVVMSLFRIRELAKAQATQSEIEAVVGYPCNGEDEQEAIRTGRLQGVAELRLKQYDRAMKGDTAALSQLAKHLLGQSGDGVQVNINITDILKRVETLNNGRVLNITSERPASTAPLIEVDPPGEKPDG